RIVDPATQLEAVGPAPVGRGREGDREIGYELQASAAADPKEAREPVVGERGHLILGYVVGEGRVDVDEVAARRQHSQGSAAVASPGGANGHEERAGVDGD